MIFTLLGTDHYRVSEKLKQIKNSFMAKRDKSGLNVINLDGETMEFEKFKSEALATPFLGEKKMIIVKNLSHIPANRQIYKELANFLKKQKDFDNVIGFVDMLDPEKYKRKSLPNGPLYKFLSEQKYHWTLNLFNNRELANWLKKYFENKKSQADDNVINELIIRVGHDLNQMTNEADKLIAYKKNKAITIDDVKQLVNAKFDDNIFNLVDALGQKNKQRSLKLISDQLASGTHPLMILTMIIRQFKILLQVKDGATASGSKIHPFVWQKANQQARNFELDSLKQIFNSLIALETKFKSSGSDPELTFDLFIAKHC